MLGFTKLRLMDTNYWYRPASNPCAELPLVFFHGVGPGVCAYGGLVNKLAANRSAVLIEVPHITMSLEEFRAKTAVSSSSTQIERELGRVAKTWGGDEKGGVWGSLEASFLIALLLSCLV
jgi:hypothetical protein